MIVLSCCGRGAPGLGHDLAIDFVHRLFFLFFFLTILTFGETLVDLGYLN